MSSSKTIYRLGVLMFGYTGTGGGGFCIALSIRGVVRQRRVLPLSLEGIKCQGSRAGAEQFLCASLSVIMNTI